MTSKVLGFHGIIKIRLALTADLLLPSASSFWKLVKAVVTLTVVKAVVTLTLAKWSRL